MSRHKWSSKKEKPVERTIDALKRMPGRCSECAGWKFKLRYENSELIRLCTGCGSKVKV